MSREKAEPRATPRKAGRFQTGVRGLIVAVACFALISWAGRRFYEFHHPAAAAARGLSARSPSDRARATRELMVEGIREPDLAAPPLIHALGDPAAEVRAGAAEALGVIAGEVIQNGTAGDAPRTATAALIRSLRDRDPNVRTAVILALERIPSIPGAPGRVGLPAASAALAGTLDDRDEEVRLLAFNLLLRCGVFRTAEPPAAIGTALEDRSARIRRAALMLLPAYRRPLDPWLPALLREAEADEPEVRFACWAAFRRDPPAFSAAAIPALLAALQSRSRDVRFCAARGLEPHAHDPGVASTLMPALRDFLRRPLDPGDALIPEDAARMLGRVAPGTESAREAIAALTDVVRSDDRSASRLRAAAIEALGEFGPGAESAVPALIQALREVLARKDASFFYNGGETARALGRIAPGTRSADDAIAALTQALASRSKPDGGRTWTIETWQLEAIGALGAFGPAAESVPRRFRDALPVIRLWAQSRENPALQAAAARAAEVIEGAGQGGGRRTPGGPENTSRIMTTPPDARGTPDVPIPGHRPVR